MLKSILDDIIYTINKKINPNKDMTNYLKKQTKKKIDHSNFDEVLRMNLDELNLLILEYTKKCGISSFFTFISFEKETVSCNFFYEIFTSGKVYILKKEEIDNIIGRKTLSKEPFMILLEIMDKVDQIKELYEKFNKQLPIQITYRYNVEFVIKNHNISSKYYDYENFEIVNKDNSNILDFETYFKKMRELYKL